MVIKESLSIMSRGVCWHSCVNPLNMLGFVKQEWLYRSYLKDRRLASEFKRNYLPDNMNSGSVLEYGCGRGRLVAMLSQLGFGVVGIDIEEHYWWDKVPRADFRLVKDFEFQDESFDLCLSILVLTYVDDDMEMLGQIYRVLKRGGFVVLKVTNKDNLYTRRTGRYLNKIEPIKRYYTIDGIKEAVEDSGFEVDRIWTEDFYSPYFMSLGNSLLGLLPCQVNKWLADRTNPNHRGVINVRARKP